MTSSSNKLLKMNPIIDHVFTKKIMDALPQDIRVTIVNKLSVEDFVRSSVVCKSWYLTAVTSKKILPLHLRSRLPCLMFFPYFGNIPRFFMFSHSNVDGNRKALRLKFPEIVYGSKCVGSNGGWSIMVHQMKVHKKESIFLLNPLTKVVIQLPLLLTPSFGQDMFGRYCLKRALWNGNYINKAIVLPTPVCAANNSDFDNKNIASSVAAKQDNCVVIAIYYNVWMAFCTPLDKKWTRLGACNRDIILYNGKLYAIGDRCDLTLVELFPHPKKTSCNIPPPAAVDLNYEIQRRERMTFYLVESFGDFLLVVRSYQASDDLRYYRSLTFKIFKLDFKNLRWIQVEDLGDRILFVGKSTSTSASTRDCPQFRENCIYFTYDEEFPCVGQEVYEITTGTGGVFHLKDNSIEPFSPNILKVSRFPPVWFTPSFC